MVKYSEAKIDEIFGSLADPTRRDIIHRLVQKELDVTEIAGAYKMSMPAISKHLKILKSADLVKERRDGRSRFYSANPKAIMEIQRYINFYTKFWSDKFDKINEYFIEDGGE